MNATIFWRMLWKEYRAQRAFWISMVVLTLVIQLILLVNLLDVPGAELIPTKLGFAFACAVLYALGSGATLFAAEREAGTYDFLRGLPVKPLEVFAGKVVFALVSTTAMFLVCWTLALGFARGLPKPLHHQEMSISCGLACIEVLIWGILFSLLLKRPLLAAILAGICASYPTALFGNSLPIRVTIPGLLLVAAFLAMVDTALAARWFRERLFRRAGPKNAGLSENQIDAIYDRLLPWRLQRPRSAPAMLGGLVRQELRQSASMTMVLIGLLLITSLLLLYAWISWGDSVRHGHWINELMPVLMFAGFSAYLLGSTVFLGDQVGSQFRFLAERGIPPRLLWLSRQIRGAAVLLLGLILVLPPMAGLIAAHYRPDESPVIVAGYLAGFAVVAYTCGQLCSMAIRSGIVSAACGTILTMLLCSWAQLMNWFGLSWLWSVAPLLLAFMIATWLRAPDWLLERKTLRSWLRPALAISAPALAILVAIPLVRVYEVPLVDPGFNVEELTTPMSIQEQNTLAIYGRAIELQRQAANPAIDESARRRAEEQAIALALEASCRPLTGFCSEAPLAPPEPAEELHLADAVLASAKPLEAEKEFDAALDRCLAARRIVFHARLRACVFDFGDALEIRVCEQLMQWAAARGQTPERVLRGLRTMEEQWRNPFPYCEIIKGNYLRDLRILAGDREALNELGYLRNQLSFTLVTRWLPWERFRAVRMLNDLTADAFKSCGQNAERLAAGDAEVQQAYYRRLWPNSRDFTLNLVWQITADDLHGLDDSRRALEADRRATRLIVALEAWKLKHGALPKSLDDLKGTYLAQVPVDPESGNTFWYEPKGLPYRVKLELQRRELGSPETLEPGRPFISRLCPPESPDGISSPEAEPRMDILAFPIP